MDRSVVRTTRAPMAIGPYSQAIVVDVGTKKMVFCSGQVALDAVTGTMSTGDVAEQTWKVLENLQEVLSAAGATFRDVVKTTIFLADMNDFATVNAIYGEKFTHEPPARATVQAARLPRDARVEIDAIAII